MGAEERALVVTQAEAQEMNARVRDILGESDVSVETPEGVAAALYHPEDTAHSYLLDPRPLALQIVRALRDLQSMTETSILVSEEECWFLERRFRHNDREPVARTLLLKIHELILAFHPEFGEWFPKEEEVEADADRSYEDAIKGADENSGTDAREDAESEQGTGDAAVPTE